jgi:hypothetical protein
MFALPIIEYLDVFGNMLLGLMACCLLIMVYMFILQCTPKLSIGVLPQQTLDGS